MPFRKLRGSRRTFLKSAGGAAMLSRTGRSQSPQPPNFIFILADDLGYGDLSCYGSGISTPNLDQMAQDGMSFTHFYSASPVCSPSRAALLTGRYPPRVGVPRVLDPSDTTGIFDSETTIAQTLKGAGYATMCIGKWHVGSQPQFLPPNRGFDEWYGIPYSIDMAPRPLMHNFDVIEQPANLNNLTQRYTQWAVDYIKQSTKAPFFLYLPHAFPHLPLAASPAFQGNSGEGLYGDVVQELDWSVGQVLQAVKDAGLDSNTIVMFTSDNGPWYQGSPGRLRGRKGDTYEGGVRMPFIARWPGVIPSGQVVAGVTSMLDILPTVAALSGAALPALPLDGIDISPILTGKAQDIPREALLYFNDINLQCARLGPWKLHLTRYNTPAYSPPPPEGIISLPLPAPELYNMLADPQESYDRADRNQTVVNDIKARVTRLIQTFPPQVVNAWNATLAIQVQPTDEDALPQPVPPPSNHSNSVEAPKPFVLPKKKHPID